MDKFLKITTKMGKTWFVLAVAVFTGLLMSLFSSVVSIIFEKNVGWEQLYSAPAAGMFAGGFIGGVFIGIGLWYTIKKSQK